MKQPKEVAKELVDKFANIDMVNEDGHIFWIHERVAKQCALIAVDEIIEALNIPEWDGNPENSPKDLGDALFWQAVKKELIK